MVKRGKSKASVAVSWFLSIFVVLCVFVLGFVCAKHHYQSRSLSQSQSRPQYQHTAPIVVVQEPQIGLGPEPEPGRNKSQTGNPPVYPSRPPEYPLRGQRASYQQLGVLVRSSSHPSRDPVSGSDASPIMLPLFGRKLTRNDRWEYYCASDKFHMMQLPVVFEKRDCQDDVGCEEIYNGQHVTVPDYGEKPFVARIYKYNVNALS